MPIYELTSNAIIPIDEITLSAQGIRERYDLQRLLKANVHCVSPETFVLAEEYSKWEESRRSIDLLCLDKEANLVVVELKRTEDGGHMELQAIRYAAMVSKMTFSDAVEAHSEFLRKNGGNFDDAEAAILRFLDWDEAHDDEFAQNVHIVLVSADFGKEITTAVMWLNERDLDIRCVRLRPYKLGEKTLLDIQQVIPLPEAADYQIQLRKKAAKERQAQERGPDWSRYDLKVGDRLYPNLLKRHLFYQAVRALIDRGVGVGEVQKVMPASKLLGIPGNLSTEEFRNRASQMATPNGASYNFRRFFADDDELFRSEGATWALSNQWSLNRLPILDELIKNHPEAGMSYSKVTAEPGV